MSTYRFLARREFLRLIGLSVSAAACGSSSPSGGGGGGGDGAPGDGASGDGASGDGSQGDGSQGDGSPADGSSGLDGGVAGDGGSDGGRPVDLPQVDLARVIPAVLTFANTLLGDTSEARRTKLLAFLNEQPEVESAGIGADGVWALFKNFVPLMFLDNRLTTPEPEEPLLTTLANTDVPHGTRARVINAMGNFYADETIAVRSILQKKGYSVVSDPGTLDSLRSLSGDSVFYMSAHGGLCQVPVFDPNGNPVRDGTGKPQTVEQFGIWTRTPVDETKVNEQLADLQSGYLGIGVELNDYSADRQSVLYAAHYYVTELWALDRWGFAKDALVWMSACQSASTIAQGFVSACIDPVPGFPQKGGMYVGWTESVGSNAAHLTAKFVLDRLAGANVAQPKESPAQRPFDHVAVWGDLRSRGLHLHPKPLGGGTTELVYRTAASSKLGMLAPSLEYVLIDEYNDEAILVGEFGKPAEDERAVLIGGLEATVNDWTESRVRVALPRAGTGSKGDVVVSVRGHDSNTRRITEWNVQFTSSTRDTDLPGCNIDGVITLRFRADVGDYRDKPGKAPLEPVRFAYATRDSQASVIASGSYYDSDQECTTEYDGSGTLFAAGFDSTGTQMIVNAMRVDTKTKQMAIGLAFGASTFPWSLTQTCSSGGSTTVPMATTLGLLEEITTFEDTPTESGQGGLQLSSVLLTLDDAWQIPAGVVEEVETNLHYRLEWSAAPASFPPDPDAAR